ncbi:MULTISPECIES: membrane protein insertion efficiency factor YidD [unclassified Gemella]|uniref:membrane protein insertion efficiency factor YidD n=1 Tax=unclassified Gemella TaxID=2624949 RepID=UPI001C03C215|nr:MULTISPECIES: membrane protein insertion efficiency factor YidD [unclassified Gemella]MBU0278183.1 membrane protein insertion efficiency factor YidD [Gemella sp. zg-1178]QWQ38859.1 membrane protein insertion efficiency factor YidD [Gemella sp. zg-570]
MAKLFIVLIKFYRKFISPYTKPRCRFSPTCSAYSLESYQRFGFFLGTYLTIKRLLKCHPLYKGKYFDNVPLFKEDVFKKSKKGK